MPKATIFMRETSTPVVPAASSASRMAARRRPSFERSIRIVAIIASASTEQGQIVEAAVVRQREEAERRRRNAADAVHAVRHLAPVEEDVPHDLAEAERGERQVVALEPQGRDPDQETEQSGHDAGGDEARPEQEPAAAGGGQGGGVGADAEEGGMAERDLSGVSQDDVEADREQREDERQVDQPQDVVGIADERESQERNGDEDDDDRRAHSSGALRYALAEYSLRKYDQEEDQDRERDGVLVDRRDEDGDQDLRAGRR